MKKCIYCNYSDPTEIELSMFLGDYFLRNLLCEKCDKYHSVCPSCRREINLCPDCDYTLTMGETRIDKFNKALKNKNDLEALEILTEMQTDINSKLTIYGEGVLHLSVRAGRIKLLKVAIEMGANLQLKNTQGVTPLLLANLLRRQISIKILNKAIDKHLSKSE